MIYFRALLKLSIAIGLGAGAHWYGGPVLALIVFILALFPTHPEGL